MSVFPVRSQETFLLIGDSITDHGRTGDAAPYGWGYVRSFMDIVAKHHPDLAINWINKGIGGNTVHDLRARWAEDVMAIRPEWLSIMIGINDCYRFILEPEAKAIAVYRADYVLLLEEIRAFSPHLILLDPFYVTTAEAAAADPEQTRILERLPAYLEVVRDLAREFDATHVRIQQLFDEQLKYRPPAYFGPEPVHPYATGHLMIALDLYETLAQG